MKPLIHRHGKAQRTVSRPSLPKKPTTHYDRLAVVCTSSGCTNLKGVLCKRNSTPALEDLPRGWSQRLEKSEMGFYCPDCTQKHLDWKDRMRETDRYRRVYLAKLRR